MSALYTADAARGMGTSSPHAGSSASRPRGNPAAERKELCTRDMGVSSASRMPDKGVRRASRTAALGVRSAPRIAAAARRRAAPPLKFNDINLDAYEDDASFNPLLDPNYATLQLSLAQAVERDPEGAAAWYME
eukprot:CAMPEP_0197578046 /NCGR_PEP_ID=MMETSP1326-20131121/2431_1 /TAXON_ID=1155430 /ORGANISM="Genus nov. species nov., Strain RCC2288" /LENGTH=133 /DNA_ID=CAMNT_0043141199 /DNA_START=317 /DNA_END=715 /DNA_ORIENTATION=+